MRTEVIQVELLNPWWEDLLPFVAIAISVGTLVWTMWDKYRDKARLKVVATPFTLLGPFNIWYLGVDVTNVGHSGSTVVTSVAIELPTKQYLHQPDSPAPTVSLPKKLEPGDSFTYAFSLEAIARELVERNIDPSKIRPFANSGHGKSRGKVSAAALKMLQREMEKVKERASAETTEEAKR